MNEVVIRKVATSSRLAWMVVGALAVLLVMGVASIVSLLVTHDVAKACSPDGRICITRQQAPRVVQVGPVDRIWVSVDLHENCGTHYPTPFELPDGPIDATFQSKSVELRGTGGARITYHANGC